MYTAVMPQNTAEGSLLQRFTEQKAQKWSLNVATSGRNNINCCRFIFVDCEKHACINVLELLLQKYIFLKFAASFQAQNRKETIEKLKNLHFLNKKPAANYYDAYSHS